MVSQALIQKKAAYGYAKAASKLGVSAKQYRPIRLSDPFGNFHAQIMTAFDTGPLFTFKGPLMWGRPLDYVLTDTTDIVVGDIIVERDTFFIARMDPFRPPCAVRCNRTLSLYGSVPTGGSNGGEGSDPSACPITGYDPDYGTLDTDTTGTPTLKGWPASIIITGGHEPSFSHTPGAARQLEHIILLPVLPEGYIPHVYDQIIDDIGRRFQVVGVDISQFGNKLRVIHNIVP